MKVSQLIEELKKCNPAAEVLYAYDEYGRHGVHWFITTNDCVLMTAQNEYIVDANTDEIITFFQEDIGNLTDDIQELIDNGAVITPSIKLFPA